MSFTTMIAKTATSVCTICFAPIALNETYTRDGYDGRHLSCHEALAAALEKAATAFYTAARAQTKKAKTQVALPTDAEQRALYHAAKKADTLDVIVSGGRKAKAKEEAKPEPKAATKATTSDKAADWDKRKKALDTGLELKRLTPEQHAAGVAKLGARPVAVKA